MSSVRVDGISMSFQNLLAKISFHHHFSGKHSGAVPPWAPRRPAPGPCLAQCWSLAVVERVDSCASMYSRSVQGHHVCLLVKKVRPRVRAEGERAVPRSAHCRLSGHSGHLSGHQAVVPRTCLKMAPERAGTGSASPPRAAARAERAGGWGWGRRDLAWREAGRPCPASPPGRALGVRGWEVQRCNAAGQPAGGDEGNTGPVLRPRALRGRPGWMWTRGWTLRPLLLSCVLSHATALIQLHRPVQTPEVRVAPT